MTEIDDPAGWRDRARRLADALERQGAIRDPRWRAAVEAVPRHVFVPRFYDTASDGGFAVVDGADPAQRDAWLAAVYSDETLVTQLGSAPVPDEFGGGAQVRPTSSSTAPSLMLRMLTDLEVADGNQVLEIGTGTGYNAALLSARLGDSHVASVELHPDLLNAARERLSACGYAPLLRTGDGAGGLPDAAPYDRVIATAATSVIPPAWIVQTRPGGIILADLRGDIAGGLVKLRKIDAGTAQGRFLDYPGWFMWLRPHPGHPLRNGEKPYVAVDKRGASHTRTRTDPSVLSEPDFAFAAQLHLPNVRLLPPFASDDGYLLVSTTDSSWAETSAAPGDDGRWRVGHGGPRDLWSAVERAHLMWTDAGRPGLDRFGVTASPAGQRVWLDDPDRLPAWDLPIGKPLERPRR
jgi:methyltransferase of ATP-grasp peptide maturase system